MDNNEYPGTKAELAVGVNFPAERLLKALGLGDMRGITRVTLEADGSEIVTITLTKNLRPHEVRSLLAQLEIGPLTVETVNITFKD
jgi:hypothetical protein